MYIYLFVSDEELCSDKYSKYWFCLTLSSLALGKRFSPKYSLYSMHVCIKNSTQLCQAQASWVYIDRSFQLDDLININSNVDQFDFECFI